MHETISNNLRPIPATPQETWSPIFGIIRRVLTGASTPMTDLTTLEKWSKFIPAIIEICSVSRFRASLFTCFIIPSTATGKTCGLTAQIIMVEFSTTSSEN